MQERVTAEERKKAEVSTRLIRSKTAYSDFKFCGFSSLESRHGGRTGALSHPAATGESRWVRRRQIRRRTASFRHSSGHIYRLRQCKFQDRKRDVFPK